MSVLINSYSSRFLNKSKTSAITPTPTQPDEQDEDSDNYGTGRSRYMALKERRNRLARSRSSHLIGNDDDDMDEPVSPTTASPSAYLASRYFLVTIFVHKTIFFCRTFFLLLPFILFFMSISHHHIISVLNLLEKRIKKISRLFFYQTNKITKKFHFFLYMLLYACHSSQEF